MPAFKKYIVVLVAAIFTVSVIGAPIALYRCSLNGKYRTENCCAGKTTQTQGENVSAHSCMVVTDIGSPLKTNVTPSFHKTFSARITVLGVIPDQTIVPPSITPAFIGASPEGSHPPPLALSCVLRI